jgi:hypothetical protein
MACRGSVDKSARRIRSTFADQFKVTPKRRAFFFGDVRRPQTQLSGSVRAWSCLLGLSRVGDEDHCGVTRRNFAVSVLRPRIVAIDPAASDTHTPCIPGRASTNRFPGFSREALAHIGQPSCRSMWHARATGTRYALQFHTTSCLSHFLGSVRVPYNLPSTKTSVRPRSYFFRRHAHAGPDLGLDAFKDPGHSLQALQSVAIRWPRYLDVGHSLSALQRGPRR